MEKVDKSSEIYSLKMGHPVLDKAGIWQHTASMTHFVHHFSVDSHKLDNCQHLVSNNKLQQEKYKSPGGQLTCSQACIVSSSSHLYHIVEDLYTSEP